MRWIITNSIWRRIRMGIAGCKGTGVDWTVGSVYRKSTGKQAGR